MPGRPWHGHLTAKGKALRAKALQAKLASLHDRMLRATELLSDGTIGKAEYQALHARALALVDQTQAELDQLRLEPAAPRLPSLAEVQQAVGSWVSLFASALTPARLGTTTPRVLAPLIQQVVPVRVGWGKYRVDIIWAPLGVALRAVCTQALAAAA